MRGRLPHLTLAILFVLTFASTATSQEANSTFDKILNFPDKVFSKVDKQTQALEQKLVSQTDKYLNKLEKQELKLKRKLWKQDSTKAKETFGDVKNRYKQLREQLHTKEQQVQSYTSSYSGHADSLTTAIKFLKENPLLKEGSVVASKITSNFKSVTDLQNKLNQTENIRKQIKAQQENLKQQLQNTGLAKEFLKYKKQVYYYQAQLKEYKDALNDPQLLGTKLIDAAKKIPTFHKFFSEHSQLAMLFPMPAGGSAVPVGAAFPGLQTRNQVVQLIEQRFGTSGTNVQQLLQDNMGQAQDYMSQLKNKFSQASSVGNGLEEAELPNFKPNDQKTKSFLKRLELGTNFQTTSNRTYFPVTTDLAVSVGYKLNSKSVAGIGSSYKLGWGTGFNNINLSHQGIGFRSFLDFKLKGSFWVSGGYEQNYLSVFRRLDDLNNRTVWKQSALAGVSKVVDMKSKFFKKTKVQLLYDFLWKQQLPQTQSVLFRIGYNF